MIRLYGRGPRGVRVVGKGPHAHWKTTTFVGALRAGGFVAPTVIDGPMNGDAFREYVQQQLVPALRAGDVVIMDNLAAHKAAGVRDAIEARWGAARLLAALQSGPQPDRTGLREAQGSVARRGRADGGLARRNHRPSP